MPNTYVSRTHQQRTVSSTMWQTNIVNQSRETIYANDQAITPGGQAYFPYTSNGVCIFTASGSIQVSEPSTRWGNNRRLGFAPSTTWAVQIVSGQSAALWGYEGGPDLHIFVDDDSFRYGGDINNTITLPISNQPQSFRLGWLAETVTEDAYVASRFCDYIGRQPDPQAAIKAIEESNDFDVPLGEPIAVNDPLDVIGKLTKLHLIEVPLLDDEELLERKVRVWDNDFKQPYLTLYTSKAEIHIPLIGHEIGDGALRRLTGPRPGARTRMVAAPVMVPALAVNLAKELGKAMLSEAGTAAWSYVKKNVLGLSDIPAYYQEVLQRIEEIVILGFDRERSANMRRYAMGFDSALVQYDVYKKSIEERELAISYLTKAEDNNRDLLNLADIYNDQAPSIENLMFLKDAALMFMCIMQEKYVRAQDSSVKTNIKALIAEEAQRYAVKLQERHDKYLAFRLGKISTEPYYTWLISRSPKGRTIGGVTEGLYNPTVVNNRIVAQWVGAWTSVSTYRFEDTGNDFRCSLAFQWACELSTRPDGGLGTHKRLSKELLNRYRSAVSEQTLTDLAAVREASAQLLKLKDNPIPV